ncbi:HamA C-terminal domain-containing protein [Providencia sp. wls1914]|uniref:HamA C-terminal domain-containing protein n=1 Tax=Providencia sp. wls1914 TaxID=2675156 RepID=UPI0012B5EA68|nr:DUF1837 domain-containing protein [Providencia sp. wls1914]
MRESLKSLFGKTVLWRYKLPNMEPSLSKVTMSTLNDDVFECNDDSDLSEIIYNSIVEYSFNHFDLEGKDFRKQLEIALRTKIKYKESQKSETKIKYGFYGEVLLYVMLCVFYKSNPLISRGYFYNPLENSETKGYDSYHLVESDNKVELWFGEVKFRTTLESCIKSAVEGLDKAFSDGYLEENILAMVNFQESFSKKECRIKEVISAWEKEPSIKIIDELKKFNIKLIYPIFLIYPDNSTDFDSKVKKAIDYINNKYPPKGYNLSIDFDVFFIFLPVSDVKKIKEEVIRWIELQKPLLS